MSSPSRAPASVDPPLDDRLGAPANRRPRAMLGWGIGLLAVFGVMAVSVATAKAPFTQPLDDRWRGLVGVGPDADVYTGPLPMVFQHLGELPGAVLMVLVVPLALVAVGRWRSALFFLSSWAAAMLVITQVTKNLVDRERPATDEALGLFGPLFKVDHGSFPSGHALITGAFVVAVAALVPPARRRLRRAWWAVGALLMVGMVWQRTLINAHWLSDTVFGLLGGVAGVLVVWWAFWPLLAQDYGRPVWFARRDREAR